MSAPGALPLLSHVCLRRRSSAAGGKALEVLGGGAGAWLEALPAGRGASQLGALQLPATPACKCAGEVAAPWLAGTPPSMDVGGWATPLLAAAAAGRCAAGPATTWSCTLTCCACCVMLACREALAFLSALLPRAADAFKGCKHTHLHSCHHGSLQFISASARLPKLDPTSRCHVPSKHG
jgi:hypothetical protein